MPVLPFVYLTRFCPEAPLDKPEWNAVVPEFCVFEAVLGLGGLLFGALAGRPPTPEVDELTNFDEETLGLCA